MPKSSTPFDHLPRTAHSHFLLHFYAAVDRVLHYIYRLSQVGSPSLDSTFERYPFLAGYFAEMRRHLPNDIHWRASGAWWQGQIEQWETRADGHLPLAALTTEAGIAYPSRLAWVVAGLVDEDSRMGTLFAQLQEPLPYRRPCLETIGQLFSREGWGGGADGWSVCRPLVDVGLVEVTNRDAPRSEWVLRVPSLLWDMARGELAAQPAPWCRYRGADVFPALDKLVFDDGFLRQLGQAPALLRDGQTQGVVLRGMQGSERLEVLGALAAACGYGLLEILGAEHARPENGEAPATTSHAGLGPLCTMARCVPAFTYDLGPGETADAPVLPGYSGPIGILLGLEGGLRGPLAERALTFNLPSLRAAHRLRHWQQGLDGHTVVDLPAIAERFHLPGGYIRQSAALAIAQAALHARPAIALDDVAQACRALNRQLLDTLATRLEVEGTWDRLVVDDPTALKLLELERRCRHRERLREHLGVAFGNAHNRGVRALFTGSSGTGKTLAARILAAELDMDLYRVDLGAVVNKYIGETEKNLHRVLSRAEELDVILLLDEGDALLGNRTEVKSSNDRYANLETNYLLQRLEHYQGIVVVTTNAGQFIDTAFQRRMDVVVNFVPPGAAERWAIWQLHLPGNHTVDAGYLQEICTRCVLTGGQIRNAALHAALLALDDGSGQVGQWHLAQALQSEYRKAGALSPLTGAPPTGSVLPPSGDGMTSFVQALATGFP
jgi:hypothetical protein